MKNHKRAKMPISERAKQFSPFSPLRGLQEALSRMERVVVPKIELSEEILEEINRTLLSISKNEMVQAVYYKDGEYIKIAGKVAKINLTERKLQIVDTVIPFEDLYRLEIVL